MKKNYFFLLLLFILGEAAHATCTLTAKCTGGDWNNASTWTPSSCSGITTPSDQCIIIIPACATVTVNINSPTYVNMEIYVYGTLDFDGGQKINMCNGYVKVFTGGRLTGGTPGSKINICGTTVWNGGGTTNGIVEYGGGTTLPIELLSFEANYNPAQKCVDASWITATETNSQYFILQSSVDGINFQEVLKVAAAGNSTSTIEYKEIDPTPVEGISYYRLVQTDFDGSWHYSDIVPVNFSYGENAGLNGFALFPNPSESNSAVLLRLNIDKDKPVLVVVRDLQGKECYSRTLITTEKNPLIVVDPDQHIAAGTYLIVASSENKIYSRKLVIR